MDRHGDPAMHSRYLVMLPWLLLATACGGGSSGTTETDRTPVGAATPALLPESEIAARVYDTSYSVPAGFYVDERANTDRSFTIHHVIDGSASYELCTDDYATAETWESRDNQSRSVKGYFVGSYENDRYFEFVRELSYDNDVGNIDDVTSPGYARVFKCSSINRDGVNRMQMDGYAGTLGNAPLTAASVQSFSEYLWQFVFFPAGRPKVIDSVGNEDDWSIGHTLVLASAVNQGSGRCDRIDVSEWRYSADRATGQVTRDYATVKSFEAEFANGVVRLCN